ncbi:orotidine-5'-phosphate decarboxylase [Virgibacillus halophilus]|uniref:Orotidine 5'-phosphate decarboxylase n=1 Tax=Tigheibacillus halophilus TaxID=361280 RepID=A0ABU5CAI0_9BACI|nr:orotidine-5'-phosphate decarboxylase [Virgibacillus halophilus]
MKEDGHPVFLDLKLHDIPTTVANAMHNLANLGVNMVTVHTLGGSEMIRNAKAAFNQGAQPGAKLIAVTILTSMDNQMLHLELHMAGNVKEEAVHLAQVAKNSGADGVVCAVNEAAAIKQACSNDFLTVTPGIRLDRLHNNDQKRVATPSEAIRNGADILVIGRSVTKASDPKKAYENVLEEMANA